jgi:hypothetical protein
MRKDSDAARSNRAPAMRKPPCHLFGPRRHRQSIYANHLHKHLTPAGLLVTLRVFMHDTRRHLGSLGAFLALVAMWVLPALHAPCNDSLEEAETCCSHESSDHHDHDSGTPTRHHDEHDEHRCGLCQLIAIAPYGGLPHLGAAEVVFTASAIGSVNTMPQWGGALRPLDVTRGRGPPAGFVQL